jgi:Uma2 family endonuclease
MSETKLFTVDEFLEWAGAREERYELIAGVPIEMSRSSSAHSVTAVRIIAALAQHVIANQLGVVTDAHGAYVLERGPDTVRIPDVAFVRADRVPPGGVPPIGLLEAPDLAVEIISPSNRRRALLAKAQQFFAAGTREVWIVDMKRRTVTRYWPSGRPQTLMGTDIIDGGDVVPGFRCAVSYIFAWLATPE